MTEPTPDPVERLAQVVRQTEVRPPDMQRERGSQELVGRLRREASAAPISSSKSDSRWRRRTVWVTVGLAGAAALLVALLPQRKGPALPAQATVAPGKIEKVVPLSASSPDQATLAILRPTGESGGPRARLESQSGEESRAWLADCGRVVLRGASALAVEENSPSGISLYLDRGTLLVSFDRDTGRGLTVRTRDALVRVTGTIFAVAAGTGPTRVSVSRGSVEVAAGGLPISVAAGKSWQVGAASLSAPDPSTALALRELRALDAPTTVASVGRGPRAGAPVEHGPSEAPRTSPEPASIQPPTTAGESKESDAEAIYRAAEESLAAGRSTVAKGLLEGLVAKWPHDPLVAPALYELGRLSFAAKNYRQAREQLQAVRDSRQSAAQPFREPAAFLLCRSEVDSGERNAARSCLEHFRTTFPDSPHGSDALALLATLRLGERDCGPAKLLVEEYLRRFPTGAHAERLTEGAKACK
jgi:ferric-dicitrate binding protein FerR (iron transport regulator)/outer membrane protein assembly factor BamD (BamD/ComL family)